MQDYLTILTLGVVERDNSKLAGNQLSLKVTEESLFICTLPPSDCDYSKRVGRTKVLFTRSRRGHNTQPRTFSPSHRKHRESNVWQQRFWEHALRTEVELSHYLDYVHYNPVKHGLVRCPHQWPYSSFHKMVSEGLLSTRLGLPV